MEDVADVTMREDEDTTDHIEQCDRKHYDGDPCNGHDEEDDEDIFYDEEYETRKRIFEQLMEEHPDMAFTGESVRGYLDNGDDLESAGMEDAHLEMMYEDRYLADDDMPHGY